MHLNLFTDKELERLIKSHKEMVAGRNERLENPKLEPATRRILQHRNYDDNKTIEAAKTELAKKRLTHQKF